MGQLGLGQYQNSFVPEMIDIKDVVDIACGWQHSVILNNEGYVYTFGCNEFNQLGNEQCDNLCVPTLVEIEEEIFGVKAGHSTSAGLTKKGKLYVWGCNVDFRLFSKQG